MRLLLYKDLDTRRVKAAFTKLRAAIEAGDFRSADVKKLAPTPYWHAKLDYTNRLLLQFARCGDESRFREKVADAHNRRRTGVSRLRLRRAHSLPSFRSARLAGAAAAGSRNVGGPGSDHARHARGTLRTTRTQRGTSDWRGSSSSDTSHRSRGSLAICMGKSPSLGRRAPAATYHETLNVAPPHFNARESLCPSCAYPPLREGQEVGVLRVRVNARATVGQ